MQAWARPLLVALFMPALAVATDLNKGWTATITVDHPRFHEQHRLFIRPGDHGWTEKTQVLRNPQSIVTSISTGKDRIVYEENTVGTRVHLYLEPEHVQSREVIATIDLAFPDKLNYQPVRPTRPQITRHRDFLRKPIAGQQVRLSSRFMFEGRYGWVDIKIEPPLAAAEQH